MQIFACIEKRKLATIIHRTKLAITYCEADWTLTLSSNALAASKSDQYSGCRELQVLLLRSAVTQQRWRQLGSLYELKSALDVLWYVREGK